MTITVAKLRRALEESRLDSDLGPDSSEAILRLIHNPTSLTILAEKLSERPALTILEQARIFSASFEDFNNTPGWFDDDYEPSN